MLVWMYVWYTHKTQLIKIWNGSQRVSFPVASSREEKEIEVKAAARAETCFKVNEFKWWVASPLPAVQEFTACWSRRGWPQRISKIGDSSHFPVIPLFTHAVYCSKLFRASAAQFFRLHRLEEGFDTSYSNKAYRFNIYQWPLKSLKLRFACERIRASEFTTFCGFKPSHKGFLNATCNCFFNVLRRYCVH